MQKKDGEQKIIDFEKEFIDRRLDIHMSKGDGFLAALDRLVTDIERKNSNAVDKNNKW